MKRLLTILGLACIVFAGCKDDDDAVTGFLLDREEIAIAAEGGVETINVRGTDAWIATTNVPWLSISPANGLGDAQCQIRIDSTMASVARTAQIRFVRTGQADVVVDVRQLGFGKMVVADSAAYHIKAVANLSDRVINAKVTSNVDFDVKVEYEGGGQEWLMPQDYSLNLDRGSRPRTTTLSLKWKMNDIPAERVAVVKLLPKGDTEAKASEFRVVQTAAPLIEDNRAGDSLAIIMMHEKLNCINALDPSENMRNWDFVTLWERTDTALPCPEAVGRVRGVYFYMSNTKETVPSEVRHLKYLRALQIFSNVNTDLLDLELDTSICNLQHLKYLEIGAFGLKTLPKEFVRLGRTLEQLDLTNNNFEEVPDVLCPENFPHLEYLALGACRRWSTIDLRNHEKYSSRYGYTSDIGLYFDTRKPEGREQIDRLFTWEKLKMLRLSYDFIEGQLPEYKVGDQISYTYRDGDGNKHTTTKTIRAWTRDDVLAYGDTIDNVIGKPYILPNCSLCAINLNFFTGALPDWILYHPRLLEWIPDILVFNQQENGINSEGKPVGFNNVPANYEYYYEFYPKWREKYEIVEERNDEAAAAARRGLSVEEFVTGNGPTPFRLLNH